MPVMTVGTGRALIPTGINYNDLVMGTQPIAYWPQSESSGLVARCLTNPAMNGTYTGVTLANDNTGPFGTPAPWYDGATSFNNIYSVALAAAFNGLEGTAMIWARVHNAGVWTDAVLRSMVSLRADANNRAIIYKRNNVNQRAWVYVAGASGAVQGEIVVGAPTGWICHVLTWSDTANAAYGYVDGPTVVATLTPIGVWVGALAAANTVIGADTLAPGDVYHGWLGPCAVWNRVLLAAEIATVALA